MFKHLVLDHSHTVTPPPQPHLAAPTETGHEIALNSLGNKYKGMVLTHPGSVPTLFCRGPQARNPVPCRLDPAAPTRGQLILELSPSRVAQQRPSSLLLSTMQVPFARLLLFSVPAEPASCTSVLSVRQHPSGHNPVFVCVCVCGRACVCVCCE